MAAILDTAPLEQMWATFCEGPVSEYLRFCGPDSLGCNYFTAVVAENQPWTTPEGMAAAVCQ